MQAGSAGVDLREWPSRVKVVPAAGSRAVSGGAGVKVLPFAVIQKFVAMKPTFFLSAQGREHAFVVTHSRRSTQSFEQRLVTDRDPPPISYRANGSSGRGLATDKSPRTAGMASYPSFKGRQGEEKQRVAIWPTRPSRNGSSP